MRRRDFIGALGGAAALPLAARAQRVSDRMPTVGVLFSLTESDPEAKSRVAAFQQGLQALGWIVGRNIRINYRFAATSEPERMKAHATALIDDTPDVLVASGTPVMAVLHQQVSSIPIVFAQVADPISQGFVKSLSNPGDNVTGFTAFDFSIGGKWLELLKEIAPSVTRIGFIQSPDDPMLRRLFPILETLALSLQVQLTRVDVRDLQQIELGIAAFARQANAALIVPPTTLTYIYSHRVISLATQYRLPAVYPYRNYVTDGGLLSYGTNTVDLYRQAASYVDRILKGEKPGDLPVQQPTKFELAINLKTAKTLGLEVPATLLARADEVIE